MIKYCTNCFVPSTRPRITFNPLDGKCNACEWSIEKRTKINWQERQDYFKKLCDKYRRNGEEPDCIVPFSGGKDSIYVAYKMKELGMTPLLVTILPHLETEIGKWNRTHLCSEFEHLEITLEEDKYRSLARKYFIEDGRPKHPWETAISAIIINQAIELGIPFIIYGEEGEQEYGGVSREKDRWKYPVDKEYLMKYYYQEGKLDWPWPDDKEFEKIFFTQWSRFEDWRPTLHADFAIAKGMKVGPVRSIGTFTNHSQLSDKLQDLHTYLMFLKFGFGRCTSDACIALRDGRIKREEALELIECYDGEFPNKYLQDYLDYFEMSYEEFVNVLDKHANKELLEKANIPGCEHIWYLQSWVAKLRRKGTKQEFISPNRFDIK